MQVKRFSQGCRARNQCSSISPSQACALVAELYCFWPFESLNSADAIRSSMENCLTGKSQVQIVELWNSVEICQIITTFFYIFLSSNTCPQQCFHSIQFYQKRTESLLQHVCHFFLVRRICYVHLDQWISKPSKTLASCIIFLDWFWSTLVASLVSNFSDFFFPPDFCYKDFFQFCHF